MRKIFFYISLASITVFNEACQKDKDEFIPTDTTVIKTGTKVDTIWENEADLQVPTGGVTVPLLEIEKLYKELSSPLVPDTISAEQGGKIKLQDDVYIEFPSNSCVTKSNVPCRGRIDVEVIILRTKGELITYDKPTTAAGRLLTSGGVLFITAKQNGVEVRLATGKSIKIRYKMPAVEANMQVLAGRFLNRLQFEWTTFTSTGTQTGVSIWTENALQKKGYDVVCDRLGWISCNKLNLAANLSTKFCVTVADTFTNRNTSVYLALKNSLSVVKLEGIPTTKQFCLPLTFKGLPIGEQVSVVSVTNVNGRFYTDIQEATIAINNTVRMKPQLIPLIELRKKILNL